MNEVERQKVLQILRSHLEAGNAPAARAIMDSLHPADRAELFGLLDEVQRAALLPAFDVPTTAALLEELADISAAGVAEALPTELLADILDEMEPDEAADILGDIPPIQAAMALAEMEDAEDVIPLLEHPDETAGGLMTTAYIALRQRTTAMQAIDFIRQIGREMQTPYYLYVIDRIGKLIGVVGLRDLIIADPEQVVGDFMDREVILVHAGVDQEEVARTMARYDLAAIPVVDDQNTLLGVITHDDVLDVLEEEATEDVLNLAAIEAGPISDRSYWSLRVPEIVRSRFVWLLVLFVAQTLTTAVLRYFQGTIEAAVSLTFFIPLMIGTGGNAGSQTVTTVIRALALNEIQRRDMLRVLLREFRTGALLGLLLGTVAFFWVLVSGVASTLAIVVSITVFAICIWANLVGSIVPILASFFGIDPTVMSAPLISTLVDATGLLIYFSVAIFVLQRV